MSIIIHCYINHQKRSFSMADKSPEEYYRELIDTIMAIPDDQLATINMPPKEAIQEGKRIADLATKYFKQLRKSNIDPKLLISVNARANAYAYSVVLYDIYKKGESKDKEQFKYKLAEGFTLRTKLVKGLDYVFRNDKGLLKRVHGIKAGRENLEMFNDLIAAYKFCKEQKRSLARANFEIALIDRALSLHQELQHLDSQISINPEKISEVRTICAKAWTYLSEALDEIYVAGRFVFMNQPEIKKLFYFDYKREHATLVTREAKKQLVPEEVMVTG